MRTHNLNNLKSNHIVSTLLLWQRNHSTRNDLNSLSDELLSDIGINRKVAQSESRKPFWK